MNIVENHQALKKSSISIRPYFDTRTENMGLEKYGLAVFEGVMHEDVIGCVEFNGTKRYLTGLNEFGPEVTMLPTKEEQDAKIKEIRTTVAHIERVLASNPIDVKDKDFWNKVKVCRPDNDEFWGKIYLRVGNDPVFLDTKNDVMDLIKYHAILAGGLSIVAPSLKDARAMARPPKFYLDRQEDTAAVVTEVKKLRNKAAAILQDLFDSKQTQMFLIAKVLDVNSMQYKKSTPNDVIYDNLDKFINGELVDKDKRKTASRFLEIAALDMQTLKIRAVIKDATYLKLVHTKPDGYIYHTATATLMGKNPAEIAEFLKNPLNEQILKSIQDEVERYWNM